MNGENDKIIMKTFVKSLIHIKIWWPFLNMNFIYFIFMVSIWCVYKITHLDFMYPFKIDFISDTLKHNLTNTLWAILLLTYNLLERTHQPMHGSGHH